MDIKDAHAELTDYITKRFGIKMEPIRNIEEDTYLEEDQECLLFGDYFQFTYGAISLICLLEAPEHVTYALYCVDEAGNVDTQCFLLYSNYKGKACAIEPDADFSEQELTEAKERIFCRLSEYHARLRGLSPLSPA